MPTYHIHIEGQVQGVGFRPYVYREATSRQLTGWVNNDLDGVHMEVTGSEAAVRSFHHQLLEHPPANSIIARSVIQELPEKAFGEFHIRFSESEGEPTVLITPDIGLCDDCREELSDPNNRRHQYPFITCTHCGPRFSILTDLPFDREHTSMAAFAQCPECQGEYTQPTDRRFHSQTNSCATCGISLTLFTRQETLTDLSGILSAVHRAWERGDIVAIKGIGGFLLTCDATQRMTVSKLRKRKHRPGKPLAVMYRSLGDAAADVDLTDVAAADLLSPQAPIVVLPVKQTPASGLDLQGISPGLNTVGVMMPYAPLFQWLMQDWDGPIVATSGNISNSSIIFEEEKAREELDHIADLILSHNRPITFPQDDSVVAYGHLPETRNVIRRSRGLAPNLVLPQAPRLSSPTLALGADLKAAFALNPHNQLFLSQYLGNLEGYDAQLTYRNVLDQFLGMMRFQPVQILADMHPGYFSTTIGQELADQYHLPIRAFQHHEAHFGAIQGEAGLLEQEAPVLGFIWDGTGYEPGGHILGGEVFRFDDQTIRHHLRLDWFPVLMGDKMAREPRLSALSLTCGVRDEVLPRHFKDLFTTSEWTLYRKVCDLHENVQTSSMGRLFDGVAALLGLPAVNSYEGEAAMRLEQLARSWSQTHNMDWISPYNWELRGSQVRWQPVLEGVLEDLQKEEAPGKIAFRFHCSLVHLIRLVGQLSGTRHWAFSGGVFQNTLLCDLIRIHLSESAELHFHTLLPANDENIAFGQLMLAWLADQPKRTDAAANSRTLTSNLSRS